MRIINCAIRGAMLGGMALVLSAGPALASGENKMVNEKAKAEINKVDIKKAENVMLEEKKADEHLVMKAKANSDLGALLGEGILGEGILGEGILGEGILGEED